MHSCVCLMCLLEWKYTDAYLSMHVLVQRNISLFYNGFFVNSFQDNSNRKLIFWKFYLCVEPVRDMKHQATTLTSKRMLKSGNLSMQNGGNCNRKEKGQRHFCCYQRDMTISDSPAFCLNMYALHDRKKVQRKCSPFEIFAVLYGFMSIKCSWK